MATRDVNQAISVVFGFLSMLLILSVLINVLGLSRIIDMKENGVMYILYTFIGLLILFSKFIMGIWKSYYQGIEIDLEEKTFSFPKSDIENTIMDIITLKSFRNMSKRETLSLKDIEALNNETRRWTTKSKDKDDKTKTSHHVAYLLNVSGEFGSRQLEFSAKQKRDECRAMFNRATKKINAKISSSDLNLDLQE